MLTAVTPSFCALAVNSATAPSASGIPLLLGPLILFEALINLLLGLVTSMAVFLLYQADQLVLPPPDPIEVVIGEFGPPRFHCAPHLPPLACEDVLVHRIIFYCVV